MILADIHMHSDFSSDSQSSMESMIQCAIEKGLKTAAMGGKATFIPGRELDIPIVENADLIAEKIRRILRVNEDDDTVVNLINDGQQLLVQLPFERLNVAADYSVSTMQTGAAVIQAIIDSFEVNHIFTS